MHQHSPPRIDDPPSSFEGLVKWASTLKRELDVFFSKSLAAYAGKDLTTIVERQILTNGFGIEPTHSFCLELIATAPVVSDATVAIKNGKLGQWMLLHNITAHNITLKHGANTVMRGAVDLVMTENMAVIFRWNDDPGEWIQVNT